MPSLTSVPRKASSPVREPLSSAEISERSNGAVGHITALNVDVAPEQLVAIDRLAHTETAGELVSAVAPSPLHELLAPKWDVLHECGPQEGEDDAEALEGREQKVPYDVTGARCGELICRWRNGDVEAANELFSISASLSYLWCRSVLKNHSIAEEVSQESLLVAFRKINDLKNPEAYLGWLQTIAVRRSINASKRTPKETNGPSFVLDQSVAKDSGFAAFLREELREQVTDVVRKFEQDRPLFGVVVRKAYFEEKPLQVIADELGVPLGTVKRRLHHARKLLGGELSQVDR